MKWAHIKFWLRFFRHTWRSPETYRKLFRDISSCYLTPAAPGRAKVAGIDTSCITSSPQMIMVLDGGQIFYVDREGLIVRQGTQEEELELWDGRCRALKSVFDDMLRHGMPYTMSDTNVTHTGI